MKQGTRHVTRRAFLASMAALGAVVPLARPSKTTAAVTPLTKAIPKTGERLPVMSYS